MLTPDPDGAPPQWAEGTRARSRARRRARTGAGLALALAAVAAVMAFVCSGAAMFVIESPSMGRTAPVGTLVITRPTSVAQLRVGDIVTYRSPGAPTTTTHRVVRVRPSGLETRGDVNGSSDGLPVRDAMLVGRADLVVPGMGTVLRLAPWFIVGTLSIWLLTLPLRNAERRAGLRVIGTSAVVTLLVVVQHPLVGWSVLTQQPVERAMLLTIVSTGLLPVRLSAWHGGARTADPGEVVRLLLPADTLGRIRFDAALGLEPWGWALLVLVCLSPMLAVMVFGLPPKDDQLVRPS